MVDFKSHRAEINKVKQQLANPNLSYHRRRDLKRYLGRLHKEMSEAAEQRIAELEARLPKRGEWIPINWTYGSILKCSNCGELACCCGDYCPNCGARMNHKYCDVVNGCVMCDVELCNGKEKQNDTKRA